jgi:hypothetical protein
LGVKVSESLKFASGLDLPGYEETVRTLSALSTSLMIESIIIF